MSRKFAGGVVPPLPLPPPLPVVPPEPLLLECRAEPQPDCTSPVPPTVTSPVVPINTRLDIDMTCALDQQSSQKGTQTVSRSQSILPINSIMKADKLRNTMHDKWAFEHVYISSLRSKVIHRIGNSYASCQPISLLLN